MMYSYVEKNYAKKTEQHMIGHVKEAGLPWDFVKTNTEVGAQQRRLDNKVMAFHCRWATKGQVTTENAHPFKEDNILLMHNGTLRNDYQLNSKYFPVDSQAAAYYMAQPGNTIQSFVHKAEGAFALVWMDYDTGFLNFARNEERTLFFAENDDFVVWASEAAFLTFINDRHSLHLSHPEMLPAFVHRTFDVIKGTMVDVPLERPAVKAVTPYTGGWYGRRSHLDDDYYDTKTTSRGTAVVPFSRKPVPEYAVASSGEYLEWFEELLAVGSFPYATFAPGVVTKNSLMPVPTVRVYSAWDYITTNQDAFSLVYDVVFEDGAEAAVSIHNCRILKIEGDFVHTECQLPVEWKETKDFPNMSMVISRLEYNKARRNDLLIRATMQEVDSKTGTCLFRGGRAMICFDPSVMGSVTESDAATELNETLTNLANSKA